LKIIIITQNEPFFLKDNFSYLITLLNNDIEIAGVIVNDVSPFGKKESFLKKSIRTLNIFGFNFFVFYTFKFIKSFLFSKDLKSFLKKKKNSNN